MNTVTFTTDINKVVELSLAEFKKVVIDAIEFAITEKEYSLDDLDARFLAEDITGITSFISENHQFDSDFLKVIDAVLANYKLEHNYNFIFLQSADSWDRVTPSIVGTMFERAENMDCNLKSFKDWLLQHPMTEYTKGRVEAIYNDFFESV